MTNNFRDIVEKFYMVKKKERTYVTVLNNGQEENEPFYRIIKKKT